MKNSIKMGIKKIVKSILNLVGKSNYGNKLIDVFIEETMNRTQRINHNGVELLFSTPNSLNQYRADTFSIKEPETLTWIDSFEQGSVVWDIGANVGIYSCYAAKHRNCKVYAFEPSVFNHELLSKNAFLNNLSKQIIIIPLPLTDSLSVSTLNMSSTQWGGALSTFGKSYGHDGHELNKIFEFSTFGLSMDNAKDLFKMPQPDYIKIDVDGIEHLILKGGSQVLKNAKSLLIEINAEFEMQVSDTKKFLLEAGMMLLEDKQSSIDPNTNTVNQIWVNSNLVL